MDATDPFSLAEALEAARPDFAAASDSILVATAHGAGGAVSEAIGFLLSNETNANATDDVRHPASFHAFPPRPVSYAGGAVFPPLQQVTQMIPTLCALVFAF